MGGPKIATSVYALAVLAASVSNLTKRYGARTALRGVDLEVPEGSALGLIGVNGAGKTTFIKLLLGIVRPTGGVVRVLGGDPDDPKVRARIGYLPERLYLPTRWRPIEFLASVARLKRLSIEPAQFRTLLARVGLSDDADRPIREFSKGMKQRLGLAAALLGEPVLLVLDEPTDGIDLLGRMAFRAILAEERARGATVILNSHLLSETERICSDVAILDDGRILRRGSVEELCSGSGRWRVRFDAGGDPSALQALGFEKDGDALRCDAPDARALNDLLERARKLGFFVVEVGPLARELEHVLAELLASSRTRGGDA